MEISTGDDSSVLLKPVFDRSHRGRGGRWAGQSRSQQGRFTSEPKIDNIAKRVMSARRLKINELRNKNEELNQVIRDVKEENKLLKKTHLRHERALKKFEDRESELPQLIQRQNNEVRSLKDQIKKWREKFEKSDRYLRDAEDELEKVKYKLKKLKTMADEKELPERDELNKRLTQSELDIEERDVKIRDLERHVQNLQKNHRHELGIEMARQRDANKQVDQLRDNNDKLSTAIKEKEKQMDLKNIYANRMIKAPPPRHPISYNGTPSGTPPPRQRRSSLSDDMTPRDKARLFEKKRRDEMKKKQALKEKQRRKSSTFITETYSARSRSEHAPSEQGHIDKLPIEYKQAKTNTPRSMTKESYRKMGNHTGKVPVDYKKAKTDKSEYENYENTDPKYKIVQPEYKHVESLPPAYKDDQIRPHYEMNGTHETEDTNKRNVQFVNENHQFQPQLETGENPQLQYKNAENMQLVIKDDKIQSEFERDANSQSGYKRTANVPPGFQNTENTEYKYDEQNISLAQPKRYTFSPVGPRSNVTSPGKRSTESKRDAEIRRANEEQREHERREWEDKERHLDESSRREQEDRVLREERLRLKREAEDMERRERERREREKEQSGREERDRREWEIKERREREERERVEMREREERERRERERLEQERRAAEERRRMETDEMFIAEKKKKDAILQKLREIDEGPQKEKDKKDPFFVTEEREETQDSMYSRKSYKFSRPTENMHKGKPAHPDNTFTSSANRRIGKIDVNNIETGGYNPTYANKDENKQTGANNTFSLFNDDESSKAPNKTEAKSKLLADLFGSKDTAKGDHEFGVPKASQKATTTSTNGKLFPWDDASSRKKSSQSGPKRENSATLFAGGSALVNDEEFQQPKRSTLFTTRSSRNTLSTSTAIHSKPTVTAIDHLDDDLEEVIL